MNVSAGPPYTRRADALVRTIVLDTVGLRDVQLGAHISATGR